MKKSLLIIPVVLFLCGMVMLFYGKDSRICAASVAAQPRPVSQEPVLAESASLSPEGIMGYIEQSRKKKADQIPVEPQDLCIIICVDIVVSLLCLWLGILFATGEKAFDMKMFSWFIFIINFSWFIFLLLFRVSWEVLDYLVIKLQPDLSTTVANHFALAVVLAACCVYVWLCARTFNLKFFPAVGVVLFSHALYYAIFFFVFTFAPSSEGGIIRAAKQYVGAGAMIRSYMTDVKKITTRENPLSLIRARAFHL